MDFRKIILDELKRQGRSKYWLAENPGCGVHKTAVYGFLRGESEGAAGTLAAMFTALGLKLVPGDETGAAKRQRK